MKIKAYRPLHRQDVPQTPQWADRILEPVHAQLKDLTRLGQGQVSPDNRNDEIRTVRVKHNATGTGTPYTDITLKTLRGKPIGVTIIDSVATSYPRWRHQVLDLKKIRLWVQFSTDPGAEVNATVLVHGG